MIAFLLGIREKQNSAIRFSRRKQHQIRAQITQCHPLINRHAKAETTLMILSLDCLQLIRVQPLRPCLTIFLCATYTEGSHSSICRPTGLMRERHELVQCPSPSFVVGDISDETRRRGEVVTYPQNCCGRMQTWPAAVKPLLANVTPHPSSNIWKDLT